MMFDVAAGVGAVLARLSFLPLQATTSHQTSLLDQPQLQSIYRSHGLVTSATQGESRSRQVYTDGIADSAAPGCLAQRMSS